MNRILEFDIMRSIATLMLLIHHSGIYQFSVAGFRLKSLSPLMAFALLGTFIYISGYLMDSGIRKFKDRGPREYFRHRLFRLYPPYLFALLLFILILGATISPLDALFHVLGLQVLLAPALSRPVFTLWFIGMLIAFLLIFPYLVARIRQVFIFLGISVGLFGLGLALHRTFELIDTRFFYYYYTFIAGILASRIDRQDRPSFPFRWMSAAWSVLLPVSAYLVFRSGAGYESSLELQHLAVTNIYMISFIGILGSISGFLKRFGPVRSSASVLSSGSYFVYLFHRPLWRLITTAAGAHDPLYLFSWQFFIGSPVILFISYRCQNYYYHRILPRLERRKNTA